MTQHLEDDLRDVFASEARRVPDDAGARLQAHNYRPRTARIEPRIAFGALGGTAIAAGATAAVVGLGASATPAFAGWTATPTPHPAGTIAITRAACGKQLPHGAGPGARTGGPSGAAASLGATASPRAASGSGEVITQGSGSGSAPAGAAPPPPSTRVIGNWRPVLTDTRGPYTYAIYTSGSDATMTCFSGPRFAMVSAMVSPRPTSVSPDGVTLIGPGRTARDGDPYTLAEGRVGSDVRSLTLVLADGTRVKATIAGGYFLAWWPGAQALKGAEIETSAGTSTRPLSFPTAPAHAAGTGQVVSRSLSSRP